MPRILHVFRERERFLDDYLEFISKNYPAGDHHFIVWDKGRCSSPNHDVRNRFNIRYFSKVTLPEAYTIAQQYKKYDLVIFHSLFIPVNLMVMLSFMPKILKKSAWVIWGGDVYLYSDKKTIPLKIWEFFRKRVIRDFRYVVTWFRCDYELAKMWYFTEGEFIEAWYVSSSMAMKVIKERSPNKGSIRILLGNSATASNRHLDVLEKLSKYKQENIEIYLPLSYGDGKYGPNGPDYGKTVAKKAKELFGEKAIPMTDYMNPNDYRIFLSTIDIGIFNNNRQQALGNIFPLFFSGAKIFVNSDSNLWKGLSEEHHFSIFDINGIPGLTFEQLSEIDNGTIVNNRERAEFICSDSYQRSCWDRVFSVKNN